MDATVDRPGRRQGANAPRRRRVTARRISDTTGGSHCAAPELGHTMPAPHNRRDPSMTRKRDRRTTEHRVTDRRSLLKWAMLGGGAALARLFAGPLAYAAAPTAKEQQAQGAFDRTTRGMPAPRIKDVSGIQVGSNGINDSTVLKFTTDPT